MGKVWRGYTSYLSFDVQVVTCSISLPASCMHTHAYLLGGGGRWGRGVHLCRVSCQIVHREITVSDQDSV